MPAVKTSQTDWDLTPLFKSDNDPEIKKQRSVFEKKSYRFINKWKRRTDYLKNPAVLKQALDEYEHWQSVYSPEGNEGYYFYLRSEQNQLDPKIKARFNIIQDLGKKIQNDIQFFPLNIAKIPKEDQPKFLQFSRLKPYKHFLEKLFAESRFLLSDNEEKIVNLKSTPAYSNWVKMTMAFLTKEERTVLMENGKQITKPFTEIMNLINSSNKKVRDQAAQALNDILKKYVDVAESELNSILANKKIDDTVRRMNRPDLARHIADDIESSVVDQVITTVSQQFSISRKYYELKAKLMGVKKLAYHERNVELGAVNEKYSFTKAVSLTNVVFKKLDPEFSAILERFVSHGNIDVYPKKGKASGAFCAHNLISQPTYILLNFTDRLQDVLTLAHEVGHGINNELMKTKQNALNFGTSTATAEVASTFMEDFVLQEIQTNANEDQRFTLLMNKLNDDISTIFRQVACYRLEQALHANFRSKGYLSKEEIGSLFQKHMSDYMGSFVEQSPGSENWWIYWSHIRYFFYVYSYASGLLISKSLQLSVKENPRFINKVKEFLAAGVSESPKNIFLKMGIDISKKSFWENGLREIENNLNLAYSLAKKLGKI